MKTIFLSMFVLLLAVGGAAHAQQKSKKTEAAKADAKKTTVAVDTAALLQEYAGVYQVKGSPDFTQAIVTVQDGKLYGRADTQADNLRMVPTPTPDVFAITLPDSVIDVTFLRDDTKQVTGIKLHMYGSELRGEKTK